MRSNPRGQLPPRLLWVLAGITFLSVGIYIAFSGASHHIGFPLDDAWIHQTYARNLALMGEWSFIPGQPSGGSTSPLWSALLAVGYWLRLTPYIWTFLLEAVILWILSILGESALRQMISSYHPRFPWVGALLALEWHLVWSAGSGMETLLFSFLVTISLVLVITGSDKYFFLGLLVGISCWVRPEGVTLLGPIVLVILIRQPSWAMRLRKILNLGVGFGSLFSLYLLFNLIISGSPFPNTFYAKQAEYLVYLKLPFLVRLEEEAFPALVGPGLFLLPGVILALISAFRRHTWELILVSGWYVGYLAIYAWRLPVTYQYGRYVMPAMPIFFLLGLIGLVEYLSLHHQHWHWIISFSWKATLGGVLLVFWVMGAFNYSRDVAFIESEMVATAKWLSTEIPSNQLIAAHDIGAMGYFGEHRLVDLAGLISPEIIPYLRNEDQLANYLNQRGVTYLVVFPDWYPNLTLHLHPVFTTNAPYSLSLRDGNMTVYQWPSP